MIALVVGSGMQALRIENAEEKVVQTRFGDVDVTVGLLAGKEIVVLHRHGKDHRYAPHMIPSRAQMLALKHLGVTKILATGTVGGMSAENAPGHYCVPDQIIDYTWGRESTYWGCEGFDNQHIDFTNPFSESLRQALLEAAKDLKIYVEPKGCYACSQGPRLETAAEVRRMVMDGADMVGMTAMPEAALARELGMDYALLTASVNWGAGLAGAKALDFSEIQETMQKVAVGLTGILSQTVKVL